MNELELREDKDDNDKGEKEEKTIFFSPFHLKQKQERKNQERQKQKRKITEYSKWNDYLRGQSIHGIEKISQLDLLLSLNDLSNTEEKRIFLERQMKQKIEGYKTQDKKKNLWNPEKFIDMETLQEKLKDSQLCCFYCKEMVYIWYDYVLEPKQWTLERVFNEQGHNKDNVEIACLSCNRKRRCMFHERFRFTKQITFIKG